MFAKHPMSGKYLYGRAWAFAPCSFMFDLRPKFYDEMLLGMMVCFLMAIHKLPLQ
jgi:hypothetical protein